MRSQPRPPAPSTSALSDSGRPARTGSCKPDGVIATDVDWEGRRVVLAAELASRESRSSWKGFWRR
jgi:Transposase, Mutator family